MLVGPEEEWMVLVVVNHGSPATIRFTGPYAKVLARAAVDNLIRLTGVASAEAVRVR